MSRLRRYPMAAVGGLILGAMILASAGAPLLAPADPIKPSFGKRLQPPRVFGGASPYLLGTDNLGRDILARLLYGGRVSLTLATSAVVLAAAVGVTVGLAAGVLGGRVDDAIMRVADVQLAFPVIMLAIAIVAVVGTSRAALVSVLALSGWVLYARTVRASVLTIRQLDYVEAARTLGASDLRVILLHILPNTLAPILVIGSSQFATMVLLESGLSFLGLGVQPPQPSWGAMLAESKRELKRSARARMLVGLRRRRLEAYLFATTLKHLNRDDCVPPNEEFGRGKQPVDLLRTNGSRAELLNRVGLEPEPYTGLPDHSSLYGPPTGIISSWRGADYEPRAVIVKPDGNLPGILVHRCVSGKVLGKAIDAAEAAKLSGNASATWLFQHITGSPRDCFARRLGGVRLRSRPEKKPRKTRSAQPQLPGMPPPLPPGTTRVLPMSFRSVIA